MVDDSARYYDVPDVPTSSSFELLGHGERSEKYPEWVIPIGNLNGRPAAIYNQSDVRGVVRASFVESPNDYVLYDDGLRERLAGFNFRRDFLFAYARDDVAFHDAAGRVDFVREVLSDGRFQYTDPFVRLSIAHGSEDKELILDEMRGCAKYFDNRFDRLKEWYKRQIDLVRRPADQLGLGMPELAAELEQPGTLDSLMTDN